MRKWCFPYDYVTNIGILDETCLPPKESFCNRPNEDQISQDEYEHAKKVWNAFNLRTLGDYSDLYFKTDVLLLSDIFRNVYIKTYNLDPAWYYTAPGLSWDAMLKFTQVRIEFLNDYDMYLFVGKGIRGGVSQCSNRYAKANNKYVQDYDKTKHQNYLLCMDANNVYGWAMSQPLPLKNFKMIDSIDIAKIEKESPKGYILEVDLKYHESLHDSHSDFPLAPECLIPPGRKTERLVASEKKLRSSLDDYLKFGLVLKKIIKFWNWIRKCG
ncbi:hypothetical protein AVEN_230832-1 [Araneus ventricosus]|uniref:DNA-directed DNA polymerase n=1 Tax=Araneus ventricosus TaxID=182803 RepID=A0A4Y2A3P9_ARAVE|nr:hypothetical protein AVEN_230832-1 [Araneus ventricosus]